MSEQREQEELMLTRCVDSIVIRIVVVRVFGPKQEIRELRPIKLHKWVESCTSTRTEVSEVDSH